MDERDIESGLREVGLTEYEVDAYLALLELGSAPATDVAERADVPRSRIYDVLRSLEEEGYVETFKQDSLRARASEPTDVFDRLQTRANTLQSTAEAIRERWQQASVGGHRMSFVKRLDTVYERAIDAIEDAENEIRVSMQPDQFDRLAPALRSAYERELFVSVSFNTSPHRPMSLPETSELVDVITEARHRNLPAPFVVLADRDVTCFAPHMEPADQYGAIFEDDELTYVFRWYFMAALWESWPVVFSARSETLPREYVDIRECIRDVAPLLAEGASVEATIYGTTTDRRDEQVLSGELVDAIFDTGTTEDREVPSLSALAGEAVLVLRTDDGEYHVGGYGAILENVEARRIRIEAVDFEDETE